jgi:hypothetical protein
MIRGTFIAVVDQAVMSALSLGLSLVLIHFASKNEFGLYSQLLALQSLFSPLHAGVFVSAFLALFVRLSTQRQVQYRAGMARAEIAVTLVSAVAVALITFAGARVIGLSLTWTICAASAVATLGLWWREFIRQLRFAGFEYHRVLRVDATYAVVVTVAIAFALATGRVSAQSVLWVTGAAAILVCAYPLVKAASGARLSYRSIATDVTTSWRLGRWDVLGSIVTWAYAQSYVYFAGIHGGLNAAAEISAARLFAMPLALTWASYANVLRPSASRVFATGTVADARRLAARSALFVMGSSIAYGIVLVAVLPVVQRTLLTTSFHDTRILATSWVVYFAIAGLSSVATSLLRSAFAFRQIFFRQAVISVAAVVLLAASLALHATYALVLALIVAEVVFAGMLWHQLTATIARHSADHHSLTSQETA